MERLRLSAASPFCFLCSPFLWHGCHHTAGKSPVCRTQASGYNHAGAIPSAQQQDTRPMPSSRGTSWSVLLLFILLSASFLTIPKTENLLPS